MCLINTKTLKESDIEIGYKILHKLPNGKLITQYAEQPIVEDTKIIQKATVKVKRRNKNVGYSSNHIGKISVYLKLRDAKRLANNDSFARFKKRKAVVWKVELHYKKLIVGHAFGFDAALVDGIRLIKEVK